METSLPNYQHKNKLKTSPSPSSVESRLIEVIQRRLNTASISRNPANTVVGEIFADSKNVFLNAMNSVPEADLNSASRNHLISFPRLIKPMREADLNIRVELHVQNQVPRHDLTKAAGCNLPHGSTNKMDKI